MGKNNKNNNNNNNQAPVSAPEGIENAENNSVEVVDNQQTELEAKLAAAEAREKAALAREKAALEKAALEQRAREQIEKSVPSPVKTENPDLESPIKETAKPALSNPQAKRAFFSEVEIGGQILHEARRDVAGNIRDHFFHRSFPLLVWEDFKEAKKAILEKCMELGHMPPAPEDLIEEEE